MSATFIQSITPVSVNSGTSIQSSAFASSVTTGSTIFVCVGSYYDTDPGNLSISDTQGNTYTRDLSYFETGGTPQRRGTLWRASNVTGGSNFKITATLVGSGYITFGAAEFSVVESASPNASSTNGSPTGTSASTGNFTTTEANGVVIAFTTSVDLAGQSYTPPSGYTGFGQQNLGTGIAIDCRYKIVGTTLTNENPSWTINNGTWIAAGAMYKAAAVAAAGNPWYYYANQALCSGGF